MAISSYHPALLWLCIHVHRARRRLEWLTDGRRYAGQRAIDPLPHRVKKHQSVLIRRGSGLGSDDMLEMQRNKVDNLRIVIRELDGILIHPGETFSFCRLVGKPSAVRGFRAGMELSRGIARPGIGGGICQASNLIYWLALHSPLTVVERHHHSFDPFPDCGRVLPFASGATVMYNYRDLRLANPTPDTFQLKLWLDRKCLNGDLRCSRWLEVAYHVHEKEHRFERMDGQYFRTNELWRTIRSKQDHGPVLGEEFLVRNYAEVKYEPDPELLDSPPPAG